MGRTRGRAVKPLVVNLIRSSFYLDSVALMRLSQSLQNTPGVVDAAIMIGTASNLGILEQANLLTPDGRAASANDAVIALRVDGQDSLGVAVERANALLDANEPSTDPGTWGRNALGLRGTIREVPGSNLAIISVPGEFAAIEAHHALELGLDVMLFSNNVPVEDEIGLKRRATALGRIVMGPDCGSAIIAGARLGFANAVPAGAVGIVSASGTGLQEVSVLLGRAGVGISHALGVGGRDLSHEVAGRSALTALEWLASDPSTEQIVLISKPPAPAVARSLLRRLREIEKPTCACFLGMGVAADEEAGAWVSTLEAAAVILIGNSAGDVSSLALAADPPEDLSCRPGKLLGLYSGGTLCAEAQTILRDSGMSLSSNAPIEGVSANIASTGHRLLDVGGPQFTQGRPHPMLEPAGRNEMILEAVREGGIAVLLLDIVLGYGSHPDPAGALITALATLAQEQRPTIIVSVCGIEGDPQGFRPSCTALREAGLLVAPSAAAAARWAQRALSV